MDSGMSWVQVLPSTALHKLLPWVPGALGRTAIGVELPPAIGGKYLQTVRMQKVLI